MKFQKSLIVCLILFAANVGYALQADEILLIANSDIPASVQLAQYYCEKRAVPKVNILALPLGKDLRDTISRVDYEKRLAEPIRNKLYTLEFDSMAAEQPQKTRSGPAIKCLLTTFGVPIKVGKRGPLSDKQRRLKRLNKLIEQEKAKLDKSQKQNNHRLAQLQSAINRVTGKETNASVDSELSMVMFAEYELYRWQPNQLKENKNDWDVWTLMVSRIDGPGSEIARGLIDKAILAEQNGLIGIAYIDSGYSRKNKSKHGFLKYDKSLWDLADFLRSQKKTPVVEERSLSLFAPEQCPSAALYCGWYSLKKYIDAFDFVDGAIGYHIASWEAVNLRDAGSSQWCPAMLKDGITATLGAVSEPYLQAFPLPKDFFAELFDGRCLAEAYYRTKPYNSWQLLLIGDPLYTPFRKSPTNFSPAK